MQTYNLGYDNFGNQTFFKIGDTYTLASYTYGPANGNLTKLQYGNSQYVDYTYDTLARITSEMYNNGTSSTTYNYRYTGDGQLFSVTDSASGRTFVNQYDSLGRVTGYTERSGSDLVQTGSINYDKASRVSREDYSVSGFDGRFYAYNYNPDNGNLLTLHTPDDVTTNYLYDPLHRLVLKDNGLFYAEYSYTPGAGTNATTALPSSLSYSSQGTPWYSTSYIYDQIGNISSQTASDGTIGYTYDAQSQLTREEYDAINYYTYTYDTYGNIRSKNRTENGSTTTKSFTYGDSIWRDKLAAYNGSGISYDNAGNPTYYYDGTSFTWMQGRRLATANNFSKGLSVSYAYNPDGLRLRQTVNGMVHNYVWQGNKLLTESYGTIRLEFMYDETGSPCGFIYNGTPYYYIINLQGDVIQVRDTEGTVQAEYRYNAWGEILSSSGSLASINPIRYRGYYYDAETGLYCVGRRYYDPVINRWINADDTEPLLAEQDGFLRYNLFAYCFNNPANLSDETGVWPSWATKVLIGTAVIVAAAIITVATGGAGAGIAGFIAAGALKGAIIGAATGAAVGATTTAVGHRISTGSWQGAGRAALEGAADGYMWGSITGFVSGGVGNAAKVGQAAKAWGSAGGRSSLQNMNVHYGKHVINEGHAYLGKNVVHYTSNAKSFFAANQSIMKLTTSGNYSIRAPFVGYKAGGFFSQSGKIFSFF